MNIASAGRPVMTRTAPSDRRGHRAAHRGGWLGPKDVDMGNIYAWLSGRNRACYSNSTIGPMLSLMRHTSVQSQKLENVAGLMQFARALASPSLMFWGPPPINQRPKKRKAVGKIRRVARKTRGSALADSRAIELEAQTTARQLADIVLSAKSEDDLSEALAEAYAHKDFERYCELGMGVTFSPYEPVDDPLLPLQAREALLASCYTILAVLARDVAIADKRAVPIWLATRLNRYAQSGLDATMNLPAPGTEELANMFADRDAREKRIEEVRRRAAESGQAVFWPFGEPND